MGMERKKKREDISGWYVKEKIDAREHAARMADIDEWYKKRHRFNYRTVPIEIPGKMLAAIGKMALEEKIQFSEFVERILDEYLMQKGIKWR
jgi:hypothetical protein